MSDHEILLQKCAVLAILIAVGRVQTTQQIIDRQWVNYSKRTFGHDNIPRLLLKN